MQWLKYKVELLPIPSITIDKQEIIAKITKEILVNTANGNNSTDLENQLNSVIYLLFGFTPEEVSIIEDYCHIANK